MFSFPEILRRATGAPKGRWVALKAAGVLAVWLVGTSLPAVGQTTDKFLGVGRAATPREVAAWDIDVRPDFIGVRLKTERIDFLVPNFRPPLVRR